MSHAAHRRPARRPAAAVTQPLEPRWLMAATLLGYYPLDGNLLDASGNGNNGTPGSTALTYAPGHTGASGDQGALFGGTDNNQYFTVPINLNDYAQVTMGAWVHVGATDPIRGIVSNDQGSFGRTIDIDDRAGTTGLSAFAGGTGVVGGATPSGEGFDFVAVVYDRTAGTVTLDTNGALTTYTGTPPDGATVLTVGRNPSFDSPFGGVIDDLFVYGSALTQSDLDSIQATNNGGVIGGVGNTAVTAPVTVHVYDDPTQSGSTATPLAGRQVFVDVNGDGVPEAGEPSAVTDASGSATLTVPAGTTSEIAEVLPDGVAQTLPATAEFTVAGNTTGDTVNFFTRALSTAPTQTGAFYTNFALTNLPAGTFETDAAVTQPDGKILVAGTSHADANNPRSFVARFFADGVPDLNFGSGGLAYGPAGSAAVGVVEEPDGTVYLASNGAGPATVTATVSGFTPDGAALSVGPYTTPAGAAATADQYGLALMPDGSLLLAGIVQPTGTGTAVTFATDLAESTLQPVAAFGTNGTATGTAGVAAGPVGALIGAPLVSGTGTVDLVAEQAAGGLLLETYSANGALTASAALPAGPNGFVPEMAALQSDGKVLVAGTSTSPDGSSHTVTVLRANPDGSADATFGTNGVATEDDSSLVNPAGTLWVCDLGVLPDGTILATGKYAGALAAGGGTVFQSYCQEYTSSGAELLGYGNTNSLVATADQAAGDAALARATGVLPTATATTGTTNALSPAFVNGSVGFDAGSRVAAPVMLNGAGVADLLVQTAAPAAVWQTPRFDPITAPNSTAAQELQVEFTDPIGVNLASVYGSHLRVALPDGTSTTAAFDKIEATGSARALFADYVLPADAVSATGAWTAAVNGTYTVTLAAGQVRNTSVAARTDAALGTFTVNVAGATGTAAAAVTLAAASTAVKTGTLATFTATVAGVSSSADATGTVTFTTGTTTLGTATLGTDGTATFATAELPAGTDTVTATYSGDATYAAGPAGTVAVTVTAPAAGAAALTPGLARVALPKTTVIAGTARPINAPVTITNDGGTASTKGTVTVNLYASADTTLDGGDVLVGSVIRPLASLKAGRSATVPLTVKKLPADLPAGTYHLLAQVIDPDGFGRTTPSAGTVTVAAPATTPSVTVTKLAGKTTLAAGGKAAGTLAALTLADGGNVALAGPVTVTLYLTASSTLAAGGALPADAVRVTAKTVRVSVPVGRSAKLSIALGAVPAGVSAGAYHLVAVVDVPAVNGAPAATVAAISSTALTVTA